MTDDIKSPYDTPIPSDPHTWDGVDMSNNNKENFKGGMDFLQRAEDKAIIKKNDDSV